MDLEKLYKMQKELDVHILENIKNREGKEIDELKLLHNTVLALQVEVAELANATRCFKHWSIKGSEKRETLLEELSDIWHFYLSIGNQLGYQMGDIYEYYSFDGVKKDYVNDTVLAFVRLMATVNKMPDNLNCYTVYGHRLSKLGELMGFTDAEIEQAYLIKHEENYRRQREGY